MEHGSRGAGPGGPEIVTHRIPAIEVYQVTAYVLYLNDIIEENTVINGETLREIKMPNADGFIDRSQIQ